jgi:hypothetical protein
VADSQLFAFDGGAGPLSFQPQNQAGSCLVVKGKAIDIVGCNDGDAGQSFTFGDAAGAGDNNGGNNNDDDNSDNNNGGNGEEASSTCTKSTRTVTVAPTQTEGNAGAQPTTAAPDAGGGGGGGGAAGDIPTANPTEPVPVSGAGGTLQPTAAAESHQRDETAKRAFSGVSIRAPDGRCLFVDPTAGDFRQNLIPVSLVDCTGSPNEKWDLITEGKHNTPNADRPAALIVSALVGLSLGVF